MDSFVEMGWKVVGRTAAVERRWKAVVMLCVLVVVKWCMLCATGTTGTLEY